MLRALPPTFGPALQQIRLLQVEKGFCRKNRVVLPFATTSVHVVRFTGPRQTCFAARDVNPGNGVASRYLQQPGLLQNRFERDVGGKTHNIQSFSTRFVAVLQNKFYQIHLFGWAGFLFLPKPIPKVANVKTLSAIVDFWTLPSLLLAHATFPFLFLRKCDSRVYCTQKPAFWLFPL